MHIGLRILLDSDRASRRDDRLHVGAPFGVLRRDASPPMDEAFVAALFRQATRSPSSHPLHQVYKIRGRTSLRSSGGGPSEASFHCCRGPRDHARRAKLLDRCRDQRPAHARRHHWQLHQPLHAKHRHAVRRCGPERMPDRARATERAVERDGPAQPERHPRELERLLRRVPAFRRDGPAAGRADLARVLPLAGRRNDLPEHARPGLSR